ncbi:DUF1361 domain-containing protein [Listeria booriae]|uniref:DUF1361 domain-containing protein n=1 Tax=Listeria booriae TaxID=1552123 RepID=A0A7X1A7U6_9LIST|nr:DUF1361 domain-containing protein [Listeria booriae]MBC2372274.1 DUF1361 domain-containing protein [Listeria booriae]
MMKWSRILIVLYFIYIFFIFQSYKFLILNVSLAYIPLELANLACKKKWHPMFFWPLAALWLLFFPNSPYLLTDFFHLENLRVNAMQIGVFSNNPFIWKHFTVMAVGILFGLYTGFVSLKWMLDALMDRFRTTANSVAYWGTFGVIIVLSGYAIYLGRFARLHTVYLFTDPMYVIHQMVDAFSYEMFYFIACFVVIQTVIYFIFIKFPNKKASAS